VTPPHFLLLESPLFDRVNHSKSIFITVDNHHAGETFMLAPLLFSLALQWHPSFFILESPLICCPAEKQFLSTFYTMRIFIQLFYSFVSNVWCFLQIFIFPQLFKASVWWRPTAIVVGALLRCLPVMESRDLVSVSRPVYWSLGLKGLVSVLKDFGIGLEVFVSRLCIGCFFMNFCKKELLKKRF